MDTDLPATLGARLRRLRALARFWLTLEAVWPPLWPAAGVLGLFLAVAWVDLPNMLPLWGHIVLLAGFGIAFLSALIQGIRAIRLPSRLSVDRRIEQASKLTHNPLSALADRPANATPEAQALWTLHVARMAKAARSLTAGTPRAGLARRDPHAVRAIVLLLALAGFVGAGEDRWGLITRAVVPESRVPPIPVALEAWITPPTYTGVPPVFLGALPNGQTITVPEGSVLSARISHLERNPVLKIDSVESPFEGQGNNAWSLERPLTGGDQLTISDGRRNLGDWPLVVRPDDVPDIQFTQDPSASRRGALRIDWKASDDYGVEAVTGDIRRPGADKGIDPITLKLGSPRRPQASGSSYQDLTDHPWAGLSVEMRLVATDGKGQMAATAPKTFTLPERQFTHPIARAIILNRKLLVQEPETSREIAQNIRGLQPQADLYGGDPVVFLGLGSAYARLMMEDADTALAPVQRLLWDLAVRVEEGDMGTLERDLRAAEQAVRDAIDQQAPDAELQKAIEEMQRALDRYLQALAQRAMENPRQAQRPRDQNTRTVSSRDLQQMLQKARDLARMGQREQAQALLDQLREIMENLANSEPTMADDQDGAQDNDGDPMTQAMQNLQDLARRQRDLMDRGARQANSQRSRQQQQGQRGQQGQQGQQGEGQQPGEGGEGMAGDQESLRRQLGELMRQLGEMGNIPGSLGRAEQAMRDAEQALGQGQPGQATGAQGEALNNLREALRQLGQQQGQGQGQGQAQGPQRGARPDQAGERNRDPLGRELPNQGRAESGPVKIPDDNQVERSRAIFDELRRRAAEPTRPPVERDYIDRLLRWF